MRIAANVENQLIALFYFQVPDKCGTFESTKGRCVKCGVAGHYMIFPGIHNRRVKGQNGVAETKIKPWATIDVANRRRRRLNRRAISNGIAFYFGGNAVGTCFDASFIVSVRQSVILESRVNRTPKVTRKCVCC